MNHHQVNLLEIWTKLGISSDTLKSWNRLKPVETFCHILRLWQVRSVISVLFVHDAWSHVISTLSVSMVWRMWNDVNIFLRAISWPTFVSSIPRQWRSSQACYACSIAQKSYNDGEIDGHTNASLEKLLCRNSFPPLTVTYSFWKCVFFSGCGHLQILPPVHLVLPRKPACNATTIAMLPATNTKMECKAKYEKTLSGRSHWKYCLQETPSPPV